MDEHEQAIMHIAQGALLLQRMGKYSEAATVYALIRKLCKEPAMPQKVSA